MAVMQATGLQLHGDEATELLEAASPVGRDRSFVERSAKTGVCVAATAGGVFLMLASICWVGSSSLSTLKWWNLADFAEDPECGRQLIWKANPGMCMVANGRNPSNGMEVVMQPCGTFPHGEWLFSNGSNGSQIRLATLQKQCLSVRNDATYNGGRLQLWECGSKGDQDFIMTHDGALRWAAHHGKCLSVAYDSPDPGSVVQTWKCLGTPTQNFQIGKCHLNCPRQLRWSNANKCLSTNGWRLEAGLQLVPGPCEGDGVGATQFLFNATGGKIQLALNHDFCAEVHTAGQLQLAKCDWEGDDQDFKVIDGVLFRSNEKEHLVTSWPIKAKRGGYSEEIQVGACQVLNHPVAQFGVPSHLPCPRQLKWAGHPDLCMATVQWHIGNGERVVLAPCEAGNSVGQRQHWVHKNGRIRLASSPSYCLDVHDHSQKDGAWLQLWQCVEGDASQVFSISDDVYDGSGIIQQGSRCVSIKENVPMAYTKLEMLECATTTGYFHQKFSADVCQDEEHAQPPPESRRGSFLVIGDWGWDHYAHGNVLRADCQKAIGAAMAHKMEELGDVQFIINVGDSFYPDGLSSPGDPRFKTQWHDRYPGVLRSVPWYSVYGNHDAHHDPGMCESAEGVQLNGNIQNLDRLYMPDYNWNIVHKDLGLEVVALDLNKFMDGWNASAAADDLIMSDCQYSTCPERCVDNADMRAAKAFKLVKERHANSTAKNLVIFSHYPTDYFLSVPRFLDILRDRSRDIAYFSGHRHITDQASTLHTGPHDWLVGGGGGWGCDGKEQGFLVGTIDKDYRLRTFPVLVNPDFCCD